MERLIKSIDISDQLGLHGELGIEALRTIKDNRDQLNIDESVKEHMIWYYFTKQDWSDSILAEVIKIYEQNSYIALESTVVSALKQGNVEEHQIEIIRRAFNKKEIVKQIGKWLERNQKEI
ncbi:hypothetical protein A7K91_15065 [Paenibacillus oryzae]|uniref:Uncharacterized protein n=1 Tax=Paenibacillus oryzae TaxID=1844972 RepID=A0A1A5YU69_9BACL|nr:hypothetical protein [Paenibacillus oryzae]OBR68945.1 hypothetical protein A7K91_15065 [Paenibacillus oryzae]